MDLSPAQLLMSRRYTQPMTHSHLTPAINEGVTKQLKDQQDKQQMYYNRGAISLPPLSEGGTVQYRTSNTWPPAVLIKRCSEAPRPYFIRNKKQSYHA